MLTRVIERQPKQVRLMRPLEADDHFLLIIYIFPALISLKMYKSERRKLQKHRDVWFQQRPIRASHSAPDVTSEVQREGGRREMERGEIEASDSEAAGARTPCCGAFWKPYLRQTGKMWNCWLPWQRVNPPHGFVSFPASFFFNFHSNIFHFIVSNTQLEMRKRFVIFIQKIHLC